MERKYEAITRSSSNISHMYRETQSSTGNTVDVYYTPISAMINVVSDAVIARFTDNLVNKIGGILVDKYGMKEIVYTRSENLQRINGMDLLTNVALNSLPYSSMKNTLAIVDNAFFEPNEASREDREMMHEHRHKTIQEQGSYFGLNRENCEWFSKFEERLEMYSVMPSDADMNSIDILSPDGVPMFSVIINNDTSNIFVMLHCNILTKKEFLNDTIAERFMDHLSYKLSEVLNSEEMSNMVQKIRLGEFSQRFFDKYQRDYDMSYRTVTDMQEEIRRATASLVRMNKELPQHMAVLDAQAKLVNEYKLGGIEKINKVLDNIKTTNGVKSYTISGNILTVLTDKIYVTVDADDIDHVFSVEAVERYEGRYYIGEMRITINMETGDVRIYNLDNPRSAMWDISAHPHVNGDSGEVCWGNVGATIAEMVSDLQFDSLVIFILRFLRCVDVEDSAGEHIVKWDKVDADGNVIVEGDKLLESETACDTCGEVHNRDDMYLCEQCEVWICGDCKEWVDDDVYCKNCFEEFPRCDKCDVLLRNEDDEYVCDDCGVSLCEDHVYRCEGCGEYLCEDCKDTCSLCGNVMCSDCSETVDGNKVCEECYDNMEECHVCLDKIYDDLDVVFCEVCNNPVCEEHFKHCQECGLALCSRCYGDEDNKLCERCLEKQEAAIPKAISITIDLSYYEGQCDTTILYNLRNILKEKGLHHISQSIQNIDNKYSQEQLIESTKGE